MGWHTEFYGMVTVTPPLNEHEIAFLRGLNDTGYIDGYRAQGADADILDKGWCQWLPTDDGAAIEWDGVEKFYHADLWMAYLIDTFLKPDAALRNELANRLPGRSYPAALDHFTFDHIVNGDIDAEGDDPEDIWQLRVRDNVVSVVHQNWYPSDWDWDDGIPEPRRNVVLRVVSGRYEEVGQEPGFQFTLRRWA